jgi:auxin efflux carrier family
MALQERIISCGASLTTLGMVLRFVAGPAATAGAAAALGLRGDVLRFTIMQVYVCSTKLLRDCIHLKF